MVKTTARKSPDGPSRTQQQCGCVWGGGDGESREQVCLALARLTFIDQRNGVSHLEGVQWGGVSGHSS